jgi:hypothetical protein
MNSVPLFRGGVVNPAKDLNALAQHVQQQQIHVAPPLVLESGPCGLLLRLDQEALSATQTFDYASKLLDPVESLAHGVNKTYDLFTPARLGMYYLYMRVFVYVDTRTRSELSCRVNLYVNDNSTNAYSVKMVPKDANWGQTIEIVKLVSISQALLNSVPSGRELMQCNIENQTGYGNTSSLFVSQIYAEYCRLFRSVNEAVDHT